MRILFVAALLLVVACGDGGEEGTTVTVFAAASLTNAFRDIAAAYDGGDVVLSFAGSSSLREQILSGAPADVFASASATDIAAVTDDADVFATNSLQVVVPADNPGDVAGLADLADGDLLVGLCAAEVPCGRLAREALAAAGVEAAPDTEEPDVRGLLTKVEAGELDAGIVYRTDVLAAGDAVVGIDLPVDVRAEYPIAALDPRGDAFVAFVLGDEGQAILAEHGFGPP